MRKNYERSVSRGSLKAEQADQRMALITPTLDPAKLGDADLIIEAVFENMALKKDIFRTLDKVARPGAILGTNTSTLDIGEIGAVTSRPQDVVGLHFFSPAHVMPLLEIVQTDKTAPDVITTALEVAKQIRKVGVVAKNSYGFIGNRMMDPYAREAEHCLLEGATPEQVDGALEDFGMAMGILAVFDLAGVEVGPSTRRERKHLLPKDPGYLPLLGHAGRTRLARTENRARLLPLRQSRAQAHARSGSRGNVLGGRQAARRRAPQSRPA